MTRVKEVYNVEGTSQILTFFKNIIMSMHLNLKHLFYSIPADGNSMLQCLQTKNSDNFIPILTNFSIALTEKFELLLQP